MFLVKPISLFLIAITTGGLFQFYAELDTFKESFVSGGIESVHLHDEHSHDNGCMLTSQGSAILWKSDAVLGWEDFKAPENTSHSEAVATSNTGFGYELTKKRGVPQGTVFAHFYCQGSWKKQDLESEKVLSHEQGHFDICELYSRKFLKEIYILKGEKKLTTRSLRVLYKEMNVNFRNFQNLYDKETNHSTDRFKQRIWNARISKELKELEQFEAQRSF